MKLITATFDDEQHAVGAVRALARAGFDGDTIGALAHTDTSVEEIEIETTRHGVDGAVVGGALGASLGAIGGTLVALGALTPPGAGVVAAAGPLLAAVKAGLLGGVGGAAGGGLVGMAQNDVVSDAPAETRSFMVGAYTDESRVETAGRTLLDAGGRDLREEELAV